MRFFKQSAIVVSLVLVFSAATAISLSDLSNKDATSGVKAALAKGADVAVSKLGVENGFLNNEEVKITLPGPLEKAMPLLNGLRKIAIGAIGSGWLLPWSGWSLEFG